jgi:nicotinamidase-related amidase
MRRIIGAYRKLGRPIVHVVRLYLPDGSNADLCRREALERGAPIVHPGTRGAELVDALKPNPSETLDAGMLLSGKLQKLGDNEWALYKPRWDAFYQTPLEDHLRELQVNTVVVVGCNFPNCPRTTLYGASMRDFRLVLVSDAVSGVYEKGLEELRRIGVTTCTSDEFVRILATRP